MILVENYRYAGVAERSCACLQSKIIEFDSRLPLMVIRMNKEWHLKNKFPKKGTEEEKNKWREKHRKNCECERKRLKC